MPFERAGFCMESSIVLVRFCDNVKVKRSSPVSQRVNRFVGDSSCMFTRNHVKDQLALPFNTISLRFCNKFFVPFRFQSALTIEINLIAFRIECSLTNNFRAVAYFICLLFLIENVATHCKFNKILAQNFSFLSN